ncbi:TetR/AcrR family transcriptional regulator C-terminal domain-containing protein [Clostridium estertheticum]|uniref:TetR/AcrR family transcriptional regulator C-terminal domain-containing protein n=1 Tax=Clostridium estertheticum TaxID=238834 RepID=UPI0013EE9C79|nr:TetR/AcrR family transcriptional regulator C-terminal domain-containing protein [Clostridium estertheticum]MBZ9606945.1 TetR/AcrR family transcriptional regulator C-terminal domain-containing protein [Clostridium estertheticum]
MSQTTKKALASSLKKLMNTTPLTKITINDIVNDCGVNRRTFYYHFQDIYALLEWVFETEVASVMAENKTYQTWQQGFLQIFLYLDQNNKMVLNTYNSVGREYLETHLYNAVYTLVFNVVDEIAVDMKIWEEKKEFIVNFYKFAFVGLLLDWIRARMVKNPEQLIADLNNVISGDIHRALLKCKIQK